MTTTLRLVAPAERARGTGFPAPVVALAAAPLAVLVALRGAGVTVPVAEAPWVRVHAAIEVAVVAVLLATFAVQWFAAPDEASRDRRASFLAPALLAAAVLEALHLLSFPGMPGFLGPATTERGIVYWLGARVWFVGALLAAPLVAPRDRAVLRRGRLLALHAAGVAAIVVLDVVLARRPGLLFVEEAGPAPGLTPGLTPAKQLLEGAISVAATLGAVLHARAARRRRDAARWRIAAALGLGALGGACFCLYRTAHDLFNPLGHAYVLAAALLVFQTLFVAAVVKPYERLETLRAEIEGELGATIETLRRRTEERDDLLRAVSHDLRTPLQVVLLQATRLLRGGDPERARIGRGVVAACRRMDRMLRDLVDSARIDAGTLALERRPVALRGFVAELLASAEGALEVSRVTNAVPGDLPAVDADPDRLDRIVGNLVANALKYTRGAVVVEGERSGDAVALRVRDEGPGIAPEDLGRVFQRYERGRRTGGADGLGLGLFIVKRLVEAHGGRIDVTSSVEGGSTFIVTLAAAVCDDAAGVR